MGAWRPASVKLYVGPGSRLTPAQVLQEGGTPAASTSRTLHTPEAPLSACGCSEQTPPQFLLACPPGLSLPLWLRVAFP